MILKDSVGFYTILQCCIGFHGGLYDFNILLDSLGSYTIL